MGTYREYREGHEIQLPHFKYWYTTKVIPFAQSSSQNATTGCKSQPLLSLDRLEAAIDHDWSYHMQLDGIPVSCPVGKRESRRSNIDDDDDDIGGDKNNNKNYVDGLYNYYLYTHFNLSVWYQVDRIIRAELRVVPHARAMLVDGAAPEFRLDIAWIPTDEDFSSRFAYYLSPASLTLMKMLNAGRLFNDLLVLLYMIMLVYMHKAINDANEKTSTDHQDPEDQQRETDHTIIVLEESTPLLTKKLRRFTKRAHKNFSRLPKKQVPLFVALISNGTLMALLCVGVVLKDDLDEIMSDNDGLPVFAEYLFCLAYPMLTCVFAGYVGGLAFVEAVGNGEPISLPDTSPSISRSHASRCPVHFVTPARIKSTTLFAVLVGQTIMVLFFSTSPVNFLLLVCFVNTVSTEAPEMGILALLPITFLGWKLAVRKKISISHNASTEMVPGNKEPLDGDSALPDEAFRDGAPSADYGGLNVTNPIPTTTSPKAFSWLVSFCVYMMLAGFILACALVELYISVLEGSEEEFQHFRMVMVITCATGLTNGFLACYWCKYCGKVFEPTNDGWQWKPFYISAAFFVLWKVWVVWTMPNPIAFQLDVIGTMMMGALVMGVVGYVHAVWGCVISSDHSNKKSN